MSAYTCECPICLSKELVMTLPIYLAYGEEYNRGSFRPQNLFSLIPTGDYDFPASTKVECTECHHDGDLGDFVK